MYLLTYNIGNQKGWRTWVEDEAGRRMGYVEGDR
jgi:hypothetical protein